LYLSDVRALYDYTDWATERLLEAAAHLGESQFNDEMPNGVGSIRATLVHLVSGYWIWRERCEGGKPTAMLNPQDFSTLEMILVRWQEEKQRMNDLLATLGDEDLERQITYSSTMLPGRVFQLPLWQVMLHLVNHATQHRSEIAMRLTQLGHSPGELSMNFFFLLPS